MRNFKGKIQTDDYGVYDSFALLRNQGMENSPEIVCAACLAHVRRKFHEAQSNDKARAETAMSFAKKLYDIERLARESELSFDARHTFRLEKGAPAIMAEFKNWLMQQTDSAGLLPQDSIGKAIAHALKKWDALQVYLTDGRVEIDNNLVENAIRPVALGRRNWLFCGSHEGAKRAALIFSYVGTCRLQGQEPFQTMRNLIEKLPTHPQSGINELLPFKQPKQLGT